MPGSGHTPRLEVSPEGLGQGVGEPRPAPMPTLDTDAPDRAAPLPIEAAPEAALDCPAAAPTPADRLLAGVTVPNPAPIEVLVPVPMAPAAAEPCEAAPVTVLTLPKLNPPPKLVVDCARAGEATNSTAEASKSLRMRSLLLV
jgi:hypothetical protein